jgi:hypothetical protein
MTLRRTVVLTFLALLAYLQWVLILRFALCLDATLLLVLCLRWWVARRVKWHTVQPRICGYDSPIILRHRRTLGHAGRRVHRG